jgi:hypothetical protein
MKKTVFLLSVLIAIMAAGCNEKDLIHDITGNWHVQKYTVNNVDKTFMFDTTYPVFRFSFTSDMKYTKSWQIHRIGDVYSVDTIRHFDTITHMSVVDSITSTSAIVPFLYTNVIHGDWLLTNGNHYMQTSDSSANTLYQIIDHSNSSLHLFTGNEDYYLSK